MPRVRWTFETRHEFELAWRSAARKRSVDLRAKSERIDRVAHFVAGALLDDGFRLFQNGGAPLFEKRRGGRMFEIVFRPAGHAIDECNIPVSIEAMISDPRLKAQREAYWTPASQAPALLARCHMGELDIPPRVSCYDVRADLDGWASVIDEIKMLVLPWFTRFVRPSALIERLRNGEIAFVPRDVALELVLLERGEDDGVEFLFWLLDDDPALDRAVREEHRRIARSLAPDPSLDPEHARIASIVSRLGLLNRA